MEGEWREDGGRDRGIEGGRDREREGGRDRGREGEGEREHPSVQYWTIVLTSGDSSAIYTFNKPNSPIQGILHEQHHCAYMYLQVFIFFSEEPSLIAW